MTKVCTITDPVKRDRMAKLIEAMRSGDYEQCYLSMHSENKFCAMGLACELSNLGFWKGKSSHQNYFTTNEEEKKEGGQEAMPRSVLDYYGFKTESNFPVVLFLGSYKLIPDLNDQHILFSQIADLLEDTYLSDCPP